LHFGGSALATALNLRKAPPRVFPRVGDRVFFLVFFPKSTIWVSETWPTPIKTLCRDQST
jgi:hypothetical protein